MQFGKCYNCTSISDAFGDATRWVALADNGRSVALHELRARYVVARHSQEIYPKSHEKHRADKNLTHKRDHIAACKYMVSEVLVCQ